MINKRLENVPKDPKIIAPVESRKQMQHFPTETILIMSRKRKKRSALKHRVKELKCNKKKRKKRYFIDLDSRSWHRRNKILMTHSVLRAVCFTKTIFARFLSCDKPSNRYFGQMSSQARKSN